MNLTFVFLGLVTVSYGQSTARQTGSWYIATQNSRLVSTNNTAEIYSGISLTDCMSTCVKESWQKQRSICFSANFNTEQGVCEFNIGVDSRFSQLTSTDGWTFWLLPKDCADLHKSGFQSNGMYTIYLNNSTVPVDVFCDQETNGGGWTVLQRRTDGSENFYRSWEDYKHGFGDKRREFWIGNEVIHGITSGSSYSVRFDFEDFDNITVYAEYSNFLIGDEGSKYLLSVSGYSGTAGESFSFYHNGMKFTTVDQDNDPYGKNCAVLYHGAFWYNKCHYANINGAYLSGANDRFGYGVIWRTFRGNYYSLKGTEMKVRPSGF